MQRLANSMNISSMVDKAYQFYELARVHHFHRPMAENISICLYLACRMTRGNTTLLIDFAEKLRVSISPDLYSANFFLAKCL
jgi:Transcription factor TFIIB repeat